MVLKSIEELFVERLRYRCFLHNNHLPYFRKLLYLQFSILLMSSFFEYFLFFSFQLKNGIKKQKYPNKVQIFTFLLDYRFVSRQGCSDFERNLRDCNLIRKYV